MVGWDYKILASRIARCCYYNKSRNIINGMMISSNGVINVINVINVVMKIVGIMRIRRGVIGINGINVVVVCSVGDRGVVVGVDMILRVVGWDYLFLNRSCYYKKMKKNMKIMDMMRMAVINIVVKV